MTDIVSIVSDRGMVVLYDPLLLRDRVKAASDWWKSDPFGMSERAKGKVALWPLTSGRRTSRSYRFRVAFELTEDELKYERGSSEPSPLVIEGEEIFLGPIERLPGDGAGDRLSALPDEGRLVVAQPGRYAVTVHVLDWRKEDTFWTEDNEPTEDAPADFVLQLHAVEGELPAPQETPGPLLEMIPKKKAVASVKVRFATRPRPKDEPEKKTRRRSSSTGGSRSRKGTPALPKLRPGELGVGASVRHPVYGVGTVLFMRDGFPKARVSFHGSEQKVDKSELTVTS